MSEEEEEKVECYPLLRELYAALQVTEEYVRVLFSPSLPTRARLDVHTCV